MKAFKMRRRIAFVEQFRIDPFNFDLYSVGHATMGQRLFDRFIGVLQLRVFADNRNLHFAIIVVDAVIDVIPNSELRRRGRRYAKGIQNRLIKALLVISKRCFVNRA